MYLYLRSTASPSWEDDSEESAPPIDRLVPEGLRLHFMPETTEMTEVPKRFQLTLSR